MVIHQIINTVNPITIEVEATITIHTVTSIITVTNQETIRIRKNLDRDITKPRRKKKDDKKLPI